jgi:mono/diheme cytochrome c family protein
MSRSTWLRIAIIAVIIFLVLVFVRLHGAAGQVVAQDGDAAAGRRLAEAWCAQCHSIESATARGRGTAPAFTEIAQRASTTPLSLNAFLRSSHETMPNLIIQRGDADDVVAYILSLKRK